MYDAILSVDLGRQSDFTAIILAEEAVHIGQRPELPYAPTQDQLTADRMFDEVEGSGWVAPSSLKAYQRDFFRTLNYAGIRPGRPELWVRHIDRVRGVPYPKVVDQIGALLKRPPLSEMDVAVLLDCGGVGVAVSDYCWQAGMAHVSITATGGVNVHVSDGGRTITCPKRELVAAGQIALAENRIRIAAGLPHASTLVSELSGYQVRISASGHDSYSARESEHDDLVYALCQLVWYRDWHSSHYDDQLADEQRAVVTPIS